MSNGLAHSDTFFFRMQARKQEIQLSTRRQFKEADYKMTDIDVVIDTQFTEEKMSNSNGMMNNQFQAGITEATIDSSFAMDINDSVHL